MLCSGAVKVHLFVPCLVDQLLPHVGVATVRVLRRAGCEVVWDDRQICCGQPGYNAGYRKEAADVAVSLLRAFEAADVVVGPSGSCVAMVRHHLHNLHPHLPEELVPVAERLRGRIFELTELLADHLGVTELGASLPVTATYHPSCHLLRELNVDSAPRRLLRDVAGLELVPLGEGDRCCGFGGAFSVKQPQLSVAMGEEKARRIVETGASVVVTADPGCLIQMRGVLARMGSSVRVAHIAEVLAARGALGRGGAQERDR